MYVRSIKLKLIVYIVTIVAIVFIASMSYTIFKFKDSQMEAAEQNMLMLSQEAAELIDRANEKAVILSQTMKNYQETDGFGKRVESENFAKSIMESNPSIYGAYNIYEPNEDGKDAESIGLSKGHNEQGRLVSYWYRDGEKIELSAVDGVDESDYYVGPKNSNALTITEPYLYEGTMMLSISNPVIINNKFVGITGVDISTNEINSLFKKYYDNYKSAEVYLISPAGNFISASDESLIGKPLTTKEHLNKIFKPLQNVSKANVLPIDMDQELMYAYAPVGHGNWLVVMSVSKEEILAEANKVTMGLITILAGALLLLIIAIYFIGNSIAKPITLLSDSIGRLSNLDLTINEGESNRFLTRKDEIGRIANALSIMQKNFIELIRNISQTSSQVASAAEELSATSLEASTSADDVAKTIEEIAQGANSQARDTEDGVVMINVLGDLIEKNKQYLEEMNSSTNYVNQLKEDRIAIVKELVEKTDINVNGAKRISEIIEETNKSASKIEKSSSMIRSIAEQTNLLALNASIEAARAGDAGKGFAVVANEIRKLAEQSNRFTEEIALVIQELTDITGEAVDTMREIGEVVKAQTASVGATNEKFVGISNAIETMKNAIDSLNHSGKDMEENKNEIISIMQNLSAITEENAAGVEQTSASVEQQSSASEEIARASESLTELAERMQESVEQFKI